MRCPSCRFVCSELRDICPRCLVDLRPYKQSFGLPVTKPDVPYKELLRKAASKRFPEQAAAGAKSRGLGAFIKSFFTAPPAPAAIEDKISSKQEPVKGAGPIKAPVPPATPGESSSIKAQESPPIIKAAPIEAGSGHSPTRVSIPIPPELLALKKTPQTSEQPGIPAESPPPLPPAAKTDQPQKDPSEEFSFDFSMEEDDKTQSVDTSISENFPGTTAAPVMETYPDAFSEKTPAFEPTEEPAPAENSSVQALFPEDMPSLFTSAARDLSALDDTLELSLAQLREIQNEEEITLLFDLCSDFIEHPDAERQYISTITTSADRKVEAKTLELHIKQVERQFSAPLLRLGAFRRVPDDSPRPFNKAEFRMPRVALSPASRSRRIAALAVDVLLLLVACSLAGLAYGSTGGFIRLHNLTGIEPVDLVELLPTLTVTAWLFLVGLIVYPLFSFLFLGRTAGMRLSHTVLLKGNKHRLGLSNILVRCLIHPLSLLTFGCIPLIKNKRPLHDYMARTNLFIPAGLAGPK